MRRASTNVKQRLNGVASAAGSSGDRSPKSIDDCVASLRATLGELRKNKTTYLQFLTDLSLLMFLKMAADSETEDIPSGYGWRDLTAQEGTELLRFYRLLLIELGTNGSERTRALFSNVSTSIRRPRDLAALVEAVNALDWFQMKDDAFCEFFFELLDRNAEETKAGTGQYFTPRALVECMVALMQPAAGEVVQDPAAHVGSFLIAADAFVKTNTSDLFALTEHEQNFQRNGALIGLERAPELHRLLVMNAAIHDIEGPLALGDALGASGAALSNADVMLSNPPFGTGECARGDITFPTSKTQLVLLQHIYRGLRRGGRAAVVVPDNVLFEEGVGQRVRSDLMAKCDLHTVLRLPAGIFYSQGVKTNVLFFTRGAKDEGSTKVVWFYDLRTDAPSFGKRTPLTREHFGDFEKAFGKDPCGQSERADEGVSGRFRRFTREDIANRGDNLDIAWLPDTREMAQPEAASPTAILSEISAHLRAALSEIDALTEEFEISDQHE